jgi:hypothetical protein
MGRPAAIKPHNRQLARATTDRSGKAEVGHRQSRDKDIRQLSRFNQGMQGCHLGETQ